VLFRTAAAAAGAASALRTPSSSSPCFSSGAEKGDLWLKAAAIVCRRSDAICEGTGQQKDKSRVHVSKPQILYLMMTLLPPQCTPFQHRSQSLLHNPQYTLNYRLKLKP